MKLQFLQHSLRFKCMFTTVNWVFVNKTKPQSLPQINDWFFLVIYPGHCDLSSYDSVNKEKYWWQPWSTILYLTLPFWLNYTAIIVLQGVKELKLVTSLSRLITCLLCIIVNTPSQNYINILRPPPPRYWRQETCIPNKGWEVCEVPIHYKL